MRAILQICNKQHELNKLKFIDDLPFIKISGKMLINFYFDFLYQLGVKELFIASSHIETLQHRLQFIDKLDLDIKFIQSSDVRNSYLLNYNQIKNDGLIIIENFGFIRNDFNTINSDFFKNSNNCVFKNSSFKIYYIQNHSTLINIDSFEEKKTLDMKKIETLEDYFLISNHIFKNLRNKYFLPGYSNENEIIIGENVEIDDGCELIAPLIIMNNVKICKGSKVGPNTVINQNVFIEQNCEISNSIIYDNVYVNTNLNFENKLILSNRIVDKNNKKVYNIDTKFVSTNIDVSIKY